MRLTFPLATAQKKLTIIHYTALLFILICLCAYSDYTMPEFWHVDINPFVLIATITAFALGLFYLIVIENRDFIVSTEPKKNAIDAEGEKKNVAGIIFFVMIIITIGPFSEFGKVVACASVAFVLMGAHWLSMAKDAPWPKVDEVDEPTLRKRAALRPGDAGYENN